MGTAGQRSEGEARVAVITGGTKGIGESVTRRFARDGMAVLFVGRDTDAGGGLEAALRKDGLDVEFVSADVGDVGDVDRLASRIEARFGHVDAAVLNAGIVEPGQGPFWEVAPTEFDEVFRINVRGMFLSARALAPLMAAGSSMVLMGSIASYVALPNETIYTATKGAVLQLARGMALDLAPKGVRVNTICPGYTDAGQTHLVLERADDRASLAELFNSAPLGRMGTADEIARAALFLCSADSAFTTGASLVIDGGFTLT